MSEPSKMILTYSFSGIRLTLESENSTSIGGGGEGGGGESGGGEGGGGEGGGGLGGGLGGGAKHIHA